MQQPNSCLASVHTGFGILGELEMISRTQKTSYANCPNIQEEPRIHSLTNNLPHDSEDKIVQGHAGGRLNAFT